MNKDTLDYNFLLSTLMDNITDAIYFKDLDSRFIMMNKACAQKHGWASTEEPIGKSDFDIFAKEHAQQAYADEQEIIRTGRERASYEEKETWPDGTVTWVSTSKMPLFDEQGNIFGTFGISRDITKHKLAEQRAQRYAEHVQRIKDEIEEDVRMAGELQKTFFPGAYPVFPEGADPDQSCVEFLHRFNACREVSGDHCSILKISENKVGIFLCDVTGTGVRAALGTALIRGIVQEIATLATTPGAFLARMNELLFPLLSPAQLHLEVTACYLMLDVATGQVNMANARHPLPLLFRKGCGARWLIEDSSQCGIALASKPDATYETIERTIEPDDVVVLFTDGLFTVQNILDAAFGEKRLLDSAHSLVGDPLTDIIQGLENDARAFSRDGNFSDDVCIVGLQLHALLPSA